MKLMIVFFPSVVVLPPSLPIFLCCVYSNLDSVHIRIYTSTRHTHTPIHWHTLAIMLTTSLLLIISLAAQQNQAKTSYSPNGLPATTEDGQTGTNICTNDSQSCKYRPHSPLHVIVVVFLLRKLFFIIIMY